MKNEATGVVKTSAGATTVVTAASGTGTYPWAAADVDTVGHFEGEILSVLDSDATDKIRFPRPTESGAIRYITIRIWDNVE